MHPSVECDGCGVCPIVGERFKSESRPNYDLCAACHDSPAAAAAGPFRKMPPGSLLGGAGAGARGAGSSTAGPSGDGAGNGSPVAQQLLLWVWRYFASEDGSSSSGSAEAAAAAGGEGQMHSVKRPRLQQSAVRLTAKSPLYFQVGGPERALMAHQLWPIGSRPTPHPRVVRVHAA